ncbi:syntaxin 1.2 [Trichoplax adhaerens]|uniref:Syntaxin 1.2 n=1 Tax=Trichoplax adhaerens TaxID=10228 RepID=B3S4L5_TRIAD|nr:syntaxin 1.2 [Trichoplax adhaerens]EDV22652.1 syntaxin 1.2 [Trichoplax adhaerens]|eukprot:XP_002115196.1 syntaxin 1.2 [Trichoplax adhaerens]
MKDKLAALKQFRHDRNEYLNGDEEEYGYMDEFFEQVEEIRQGIEKITYNVEQANKTQIIILTDPRMEKEAEGRLIDLTSEIKRFANRIKARLKVMEQDIQQQETMDGLSADVRIKKSQCTALSKNYIDVMSEYNMQQIEYKEKCKARLETQLKITQQKVSEEDIDEMLESGGPAPRIFTSGLMIDSAEAKRTLSLIESRHKEIMKLEKNLSDLAELFQDMGQLISVQGEMIDRIEYNVAQTTDYVERAKEDTKKATKYQSKARRKKVIIIVCIIILALVIAGVFGGIFGSRGV